MTFVLHIPDSGVSKLFESTAEDSMLLLNLFCPHEWIFAKIYYVYGIIRLFQKLLDKHWSV